MIPNLQPDTIYAAHMRAASTSGGKEWVGSVTAKGEIHTFWGRTNHVNQHAAKRGSLAALHKLIDQKQNGKDRYSLVEIYTDKDGWQSQRQQPAAPAAKAVRPPAPEPIVDWQEDAPTASIKWDF